MLLFLSGSLAADKLVCLSRKYSFLFGPRQIFSELAANHTGTVDWVWIFITDTRLIWAVLHVS